MSEYLRTTRIIGATLALSLGAMACSSKNPGKESSASKCAPYTVYAQNRWTPLGAAEYAAPTRNSVKIGGFNGNTPLEVDTWVHSGTPVYPNNTPPWNSDVWYHLANQNGWVDFAAVRGEKTTPDENSLDGRKPAPLPPRCESVLKSG